MRGRHVSKATRAQAILILESCANQETRVTGGADSPEGVRLTFCHDIAGTGKHVGAKPPAVRLALAALDAVPPDNRDEITDPEDAREAYAEAAALVRDGWSPGEALISKCSEMCNPVTAEASAPTAADVAEAAADVDPADIEYGATVTPDEQALRVVIPARVHEHDATTELLTDGNLTPAEQEYLDGTSTDCNVPTEITEGEVQS